jgi:asparagine synthase (glutamine-hydrolysing)
LASLASHFLPATDRNYKLVSFLRDEAEVNHPYYLVRAIFTPGQHLRILNNDPEIIRCSDSKRARYLDQTLARAGTYDPVNAVSYLECKNYLVSTLLRDTDCMSMAHSLEVRVPLIDHRLLEYVFRLPRAFRTGPVPKQLLVKALHGMLPHQVVHKPKQTFTFPWEIWFRQDLRAEIEETLASYSGNALISVDAVREIWDQFINERTTWSRPWSLFVLKKWIDHYL